MDKTTRRRWLGFALLGVGLLLAIEGFRAQGRPRTDAEDIVSWGVWAFGVSLIAVGVTLLFVPLVRPVVIVPIAVATPFLAFGLLVTAYWGAIVLGVARWPDKAAMVESGYQIIPEAQQINRLFGPAWHHTANYQPPDTVDWITEAVIAGRYELLMVVPIKVNRWTGEVAGVADKSRIFLREVDSVQGSAIHYGWHKELSSNEWQKVVAENGDFNAIGIVLDLNNPVPGFATLQNRPHGIQMRAD